MSDEEREAAFQFKIAFDHKHCAVCGEEWPDPDVHHVVSQQELKRRYAPLWDTRNGLPLCPFGTIQRGQQCHERHENASRRIPLSALTEDNWAFAREVLGEAAEDYLARRYGAPVEEETR